MSNVASDLLALAEVRCRGCRRLLAKLFLDVDARGEVVRLGGEDGYTVEGLQSEPRQSPAASTLTLYGRLEVKCPYCNEFNRFGILADGSRGAHRTL